MAKAGYVLSCVLLCALGITLIAVPDFSISMLCRVGGILLILFGCVKIIGYISKDLYRLAFQFDLAFGILLISMGAILILRTGSMVHIICSLLKDLYRLAFQFDLAFGILLISMGAILILRTGSMVHIICSLLGLYILADALLKVQISIDSRSFGIRQWWIILAAAVITSIVGFLLIFRPYESARMAMILLGISLLSEGILNLVTVLTAVKIFRRRSSSEVDADQ